MPLRPSAAKVRDGTAYRAEIVEQVPPVYAGVRSDEHPCTLPPLRTPRTARHERLREERCGLHLSGRPDL